MTMHDLILWGLDAGAALTIIVSNVYVLGLRLGWWRRRKP